MRKHNLSLLWNICAVLLGAVAVYLAATSPLIAIALAFLSGMIATLSARFEITVVRDGPSQSMRGGVD